MTATALQIPLSLYIHIPWCVKKCPYCDFNSHAVKEGVPEANYVTALLQDLDQNLHLCQGRPLHSIFFGGGTPSLFSAQAIGAILNGVQQRLKLDSTAEITLEANPGTLEQKRFQEYRSIGINRLSIGIQSLHNSQLKRLGRIHDRETAIRAVKTAQDSGFEKLNLDLMFGLPQQSRAEAVQDVQEALALETKHFSWYQLTLEPNTEFYHSRPPLPAEDDIWEMQTAGEDLLQAQGFKHYEVSAYSHPGHACKHNMNYWEFGDYLGIGAGAHSKITQDKQQVTRHWQVKNPRDYLDPKKHKTAGQQSISPPELIFEFMLNSLRLVEGVPLRLFVERTGIEQAALALPLQRAKKLQLLVDDDNLLKPTALGKKFLNDLTALFLPEPAKLE
jgi:oxygen-independent coproporphyrinogen-3 oxidase